MVVAGLPLTLRIGVIAGLVGTVVGTILGFIAGYVGGTVDNVIRTLADILLTVPGLMVLIVLASTIKGSISVEQMALVVASLAWMWPTRTIRAQVLSLREREFVEAARSIGADSPAIILKHILPNVLSPVIVAGSLGIGAAIITESTLSFLGIGFDPSTPTWGRLLSESRDFLDIAWWMAVGPAAVIFLTVLSINFIGDGLRDALDPRKSA